MADNKGKKVKAHYVGTLDDGTVFDSSKERNQPLEFTCMAGQMIKGFDRAVADMEVGETRNVHIAACDAYGERDEQAIQTVPAGQQLMVVINAEDLPAGKTIYIPGMGSQPAPAVVLETGEDGARIDFNHELAGKDLNFEITLLEVN